MNEQYVKGAADKVTGKIKEFAGRVTGNKKLETKGKVDQLKGAVHNAVGDARDAGKEAIDSVKDAPSRHGSRGRAEPLLLKRERLLPFRLTRSFTRTRKCGALQTRSRRPLLTTRKMRQDSLVISLRTAECSPICPRICPNEWVMTVGAVPMA